MLYDLRERLDPYIRKSSPLAIPVKKPKATWVEPVLQAEIAYSALTAEKLLRAPVYKGIRDDLLDAPSNETHHRKKKALPRVPKENVLQFLPNASLGSDCNPGSFGAPVRQLVNSTEVFLAPVAVPWRCCLPAKDASCTLNQPCVLQRPLAPARSIQVHYEEESQ
jgi:hypothetical protein